MIQQISGEFGIKEQYEGGEVEVRLLMNYFDNSYQIMPNDYDSFQFHRGTSKNAELWKAVGRAIIKAVQFAEKELAGDR